MLLLLFLFGLLSCNKYDAPAKPDTKYQFVSIKLLVAPWCESCRKELKEVNGADFDRNKIFIEGISETGLSAGTPPDEATAKAIAEPNVQVTPDSKIWKMHKEYFPSEPYSLPKAIVFGENEKCEEGICKIESTKVKLFRYPYSAEDLLLFAKSKLR